MNCGIVYVIINEGQVVYASIDKEDAEDFAHNIENRAQQEILDEWGIDDPSEKNICKDFSCLCCPCVFVFYFFL